MAEWISEGTIKLRHFTVNKFSTAITPVKSIIFYYLRYSSRIPVDLFETILLWKASFHKPIQTKASFLKHKSDQIMLKYV